MTDTYNPILRQEEIKRWQLLQPRPVPEPGMALVFSGEGKQLLVIKQGQRSVTSGELIWGKYNLFYKVDTSEHPLSFTCDLPCAGDAFNFHAILNFICSVREPEKIVVSKVTDVRKFLEPLIIREMRNISRKYSVKQSAEAEHEISRAIQKKIYEQGFQFDHFVLQLSLEQEVRGLIRDETLIQSKAELEKTQVQNTIEIQREAENWEIERQRLQMNLEIEKMKLQEKFELEKLKMRTDLYSQMLQSGNWQMIAMQIAQNPGDFVLILKQFQELQQSERENKLLMLRKLTELDDNAVEYSQLKAFANNFLQELTGGINEHSTALLESGEINNVEHDQIMPPEDNSRSTRSETGVPKEFER